MVETPQFTGTSCTDLCTGPESYGGLLGSQSGFINALNPVRELEGELVSPVHLARRMSQGIHNNPRLVPPE